MPSFFRNCRHGMGPFMGKNRKTKMRGLPLPREDFKNLEIEDHRIEDRGFKPKIAKCEDKATKNEEFGK